ncbi:FAD-binding oxidoreductase [Leifsonia sp. SIMBA_070]|uniref:FAD-binding oxidoreductase n=1 Tax=Leifsonia sp. SIMBA_070 TaxID=3085810 RepID=UPI00397BA9F5
MTDLLDTLDPGFGGAIIEPGGADYESASRTLLAVGRPARVLRPLTAADVQAAVRFAAAQQGPLAVRGGGHSFPGFGTNDGGTVIDLAELNAVEVLDDAHGVVRVGGGATWGQVAAALTPHGLAISSGDTASVGVGGLTLGGGMGWKVRAYGLTIDSLLAAQVVTADGSVVRASADENSDLFWALRGGGGNLGVVTSFEFVAHRTTDVSFGALSFPASEAVAVLSGWADHLRTAPLGLTTTIELANPFAGGAEAPVVVHLCFDGDDAEEAAAAIDPLRRLGTLLADTVAPTPYAGVLAEGAVPPPGIRLVTRNGLVGPAEVPGVLSTLAAVAAAPGSPFLTIRSLGGAVSAVPREATAYAHRDAELMVATTIAGPAPVIDTARTGFDALWDRLAPYVDGAYVNFLSSATGEEAAAVYPPDTRARLATVKRHYDPANLFAGNLNVIPR